MMTDVSQLRARLNLMLDEEAEALKVALELSRSNAPASRLNAAMKFSEAIHKERMKLLHRLREIEGNPSQF